MSFSYLTFWPCFTFSSSVILLCFFRPGLAQFLGYTLGSLLDSHANFLPALLHLATLEKSLSKLGLDHGSSDLGTVFMGMIFWFTSVQSCLTLCDAMDGSKPGPPVHRQLPEFTQTHVLWVSDAIQSSHPLSSPSPPAFYLSQHQGLFKWVSSLYQNIQYPIPKYWSFRFSISPSNEYSGLISLRMDWLDLLAVQGTLKCLLQHHSSKASILWCWLLVSWFKKFRFLLMTHLIKKGTERNWGGWEKFSHNLSSKNLNIEQTKWNSQHMYIKSCSSRYTFYLKYLSCFPVLGI